MSFHDFNTNYRSLLKIFYLTTYFSTVLCISPFKESKNQPKFTAKSNQLTWRATIKATTGPGWARYQLTRLLQGQDAHDINVRIPVTRVFGQGLTRP